MSTLSDEAVQALHDAISEIALRANRLNDLVKLGESYRSLDTSYRRFLQPVKSTSTNWAEIEETWLSFYKSDLPMVANFVKKAKYIRQRSTVGEDEDIGAMVDAWVKELDQRCAPVQKAVNDQSAPQLRATATDLQGTLMSQTADCKGVINREVEQLCRLTDSLRDQLK